MTKVFQDYIPLIQESDNRKLICSLLNQRQVERDIPQFPVFRPLDHTMGHSIDKYVGQRLPVQLIEYAVSRQLNINIHGVYPEHFQILKNKLNVKNFKEYSFLPNKRKKSFNFVRPRYFICTDSNDIENLCILVTPGADYVYHYASMIRHILYSLSRSAHSLLNIYRYSQLENEITKWTNLDKRFIQDGDTVIIGYVEEISQYLEKCLSLSKISCFENSYYRSTRYKVGNRLLNFLGVKYSYWGNMSGLIAHRCCQLGVNEFIYIAKQGSLTKPADLYTKIYSATSYVTMNSLSLHSYVGGLNNELIKMFPELNTGCHMSVPTVLEEDYTQREIAAAKFYPQSIDNEISQIANAIYRFNQQTASNVKYFNMHFATDYIRHKEEKIMKTVFDLSNNRTPEAFSLKRSIIAKIGDYFSQYIIATSV